MTKPFRERNPITVGAASLAVILMLLIAAFKAGDLPLIGGGDTYYADFTDASGIRPNDEVRVAGVRVGKVTAVDLHDGKVRVAFKVKTDSPFGTTSGAEIKVKTLLGSMFLSLDPAGPGQLQKGSVIPASRTRSAYDVVKAFSGLATRAEDIDTDQLAKSFDTLAQATSTTPKAFQDALRGVAAISRNVAKRDDQLNTLLGNLHDVSGILANRDDDIVDLMRQGDVLLRALVARRESIHQLLVSTTQLSQELTGLVNDTRADLKPALTDLDSVVKLLVKNQTNIDDSLRLMAPFYRVFSSTLGNGPWFDTLIQNLPPGGGVGVHE